MKAFLTGGSGFVGQQLTRMLIRTGAKVYALARSSRAEQIVSASGAVPVAGDLNDAMAMHLGMTGCDVVFHSAALLKFHACEDEMAAVNVRGTQNVIDAAKTAGVPRLVFISAAAVISDGRPVIDADETWPYPPRVFGAYCRSKAAAEQRILTASAPGFTAVAVRPPLIWGLGDVHVLPEVINAVKRRQFIWVDRGDYPYATCHVRNVCEGAILAGQCGRGGQAYFLTDGGPPMTFRKFLTDLLATHGVAPGRFSLPRGLAWSMAAALERLPLPGGPPITRAHLALIGGQVTVRDAKARRELGYQGLVSREQGLRELAENQAF